MVHWTEVEKDSNLSPIQGRTTTAAVTDTDTFWGDLSSVNRLWSLKISYRYLIIKQKNLNRKIVFLKSNLCINIAAKTYLPLNVYFVHQNFIFIKVCKHLQKYHTLLILFHLQFVAGVLIQDELWLLVCSRFYLLLRVKNIYILWHWRH